MRRPLIVFTNPQGKTILYGSLRPNSDETKQLDDARGFIQRSYQGRDDEAAVVASVRIEQPK